MSDVRTTLAELGYTEIETYLQSGNAVFTSRRRRSADLEREIENGIEKKTNLTVPCLIRTRDEMQSVVDGHPFRATATDGSRMMVLFLSAEPDPERLAAHNPGDLAPDDVHVVVREIYQWCPDGFHEAPTVSVFVEKHLGVWVTARNWNTVARLATLLDG